MQMMTQMSSKVLALVLLLPLVAHAQSPDPVGLGRAIASGQIDKGALARAASRGATGTPSERRAWREATSIALAHWEETVARAGSCTKIGGLVATAALLEALYSGHSHTATLVRLKEVCPLGLAAAIARLGTKRPAVLDRVCIELRADPDCRRTLRERVRLGLLGAVYSRSEAADLAVDALYLLEGQVEPQDLCALQLAKRPALPSSELARLIRKHVLGLAPPCGGGSSMQASAMHHPGARR